MPSLDLPPNRPPPQTQSRQYHSRPPADALFRFGQISRRIHRLRRQWLGCQFQPSCTTEKRGRSLEISPYHEQLTRRRREQSDTAFVKEMHARARIESTICELARKHGLRQSRYRGQHKLQLQAAFTAAAVNLKRLARHLAKSVDPFAVQCLGLHTF